MFIVILSVLLVVTLVLISYCYYRSARYMKNIPKIDLALGAVFDFLGGTENLIPVFQKYVDTYGPTTKLYLGPIQLGVVTSDEKFMTHILNSNKFLNKSDSYKYIYSWLGTGLITSTGEKWARRRKLITPAFHFKILGNFVNIFNKNGNILIQKLEKEVEKPSFDVYPMIGLCTLDSICESAMGVSINAQGDETSDYIRSVKTMSQIVTERTFFMLPTYVYPLTPNFYKERKALKVLHGHTDQVIDKKLKELENRDIVNEIVDDVGSKKKYAFLDLLIRQSKIDGEKLSRADIREEVDTFMFAGHDSTAVTISYALFALANHPEVQDKAFEEQKRLFGSNKHADPDSRQIQDMAYLRCVVAETLRLYPPFPILGRQVAEEYEWEGSIFPKNTDFMLFVMPNFKDERYFPGEPTKFIPERFENVTTFPNAFVPFSAGPRSCLGEKFAGLEIRAVLSKILRNFQILPATPVHELILAPDIVMVSKNGIRISIKKRVYT